MSDASWIRGVDAANLENAREVERIKGDGLAQQASLKAGLDLLPDRVQEITSQTAGLSIPISGTQITYTPNLSSIAANTWTTVQEFTIAAPRGKTLANVVLIGTPVMRATYNINNFRLMRYQINGNTYAQSTSGETGLCTGGGTFLNASTLTISAQVYIAIPSAITNNSGEGRENCIRTSYVVVWS